MRVDYSFLSLTTLSLTIACAPDLGGGGEDASEPMMVDEVGGPNVEHVDEGDGIQLSNVDATSETEWVYLSLSDGVQTDPPNPLDDEIWDLAFLRFHIKLNGGVSGSAGVDAAILDEETFDAIQVAPNADYGVDEPDGDDDNEDPDYVLRDWYAYNAMTYVLTPEPRIYIIRATDGLDYKMQIVGYYDDAGNSGNLQFRWGRLNAL